MNYLDTGLAEFEIVAVIALGFRITVDGQLEIERMEWDSSAHVKFTLKLDPVGKERYQYT